jgi:DNA repair exonuclease SbcCD ATPase subunit
LGLLASHPKFQKYVDAQEAQALRGQASKATQQSLDRILRSLPRETIARFENLRRQCLELRQIADALKHPSPLAFDQPLEASQAAGLDRLLWMYLRLLYTQFALGRFLAKTRESDIQQDLQRLEKQLAQYPADTANVSAQRLRKTLEDSIETSRARLANLAKARENHQLVGAQLDQLENKIRSLSEMAVNRQEPEFISSQIDQVASSMVQTEQTMNELRFATGLEALSNETPELLSPNKFKVTQ